MIKIGITGQSGFIGSHFSNYIGLKTQEVIQIPFQDDYFSEKTKLEEFVKQCDVIIHLAALNRHNDPQTIYETNIRLVNQLIEALESTNAKPHILFSSSIQEERDNIFGKSKREGRELFARWAERKGASFTGMLIPNVFGPFGKPYYNSVVATFSHQLTHDEQPKIDVDARLRLIYIDDLVKLIYGLILNKVTKEKYIIKHAEVLKVSDILTRIQSFKDTYFDSNIIPDLQDQFDLNIFNTFVCSIDHERYFPVKYKMSTDHRGSFCELVRSKNQGQISYSITRPGVTRGNHFHTRKFERFSVVKGRAIIQLRRIGTDKILEYFLDGNDQAHVDMPVWYTHNITNIGTEDLLTVFWISEFYNSDDPDTFVENV